MRKEPLIKDDMQLLHVKTWESLSPHLVVGFTTREEGNSTNYFSSFNLGLHVNDTHENVMLNRQKLGEILSFSLEKWVCSEQVHDNKIVKVTGKDKGKGRDSYEDGIARTDGIYTSETGVLLTSCYADCVPLYFYAPDHHLIGLAHAGWRGTIKKIGEEMVTNWTEKEQIPVTDIQVVIGPSIHSCCYVVDEQVIDAVKLVLSPNQVASVYEEVSPGQYAIDLQQVNLYILVNAGICSENIQISSYCTSCEEALFYSHRRDQGETGRMLSFIGFKEE